MRKTLLLGLGLLLGCSQVPSGASVFTGLRLHASPGETAILLSNPGATIDFGGIDGGHLADDNGAFGIYADAKLEQGLITPAVTTASLDGGYVMGSASLYFCDATTVQTTLFLPLADAGTGRNYTVVKSDTSANGCIVQRTGTDTIWKPAGTSTTVGLPDAGSVVQLVSDGISKWWILHAR